MTRAPSCSALALAALLALAGCDDGVPPGEAASGGPGADGTDAMIELLDRMAREVNPERNRFANTRIVERLLEVEPPAEPARRLAFEIQVLDHLATAHLRLGERQNCIEGWEPRACTVPVPPEGAHADPTHARAAGELYEEILARRPDDLGPRWLLNVARMRSREYPDGVPPRWRIRPEAFHSQRDVGRFRDVSRPMGLDMVGRVGGAAMDDFEGNGLLGIVVSSWGIRDPLRYFRNEGDGTFTDIAPASGVRVVGVIKGVAWGDVDNDGWLDLFVAGYRTDYGDIAAEYLGLPHASELPRLYRNRGDGTFEDVTVRVGLDRILFAMGANFGDLDGDGWPDLYLGTGDAVVQVLMPNRVFRNDGGVRFQDVTTSGGLGFLHKGHGVAFGDLFGDGTQDVFQALGGAFEGDLGRAVLLKNPGHRNRWLTPALEGVEANRSAVGARIRVVVDREEGTREIHHLVGTGASFGSSTLRAEIGLGRATAIREVRIEWPGSGTVQELRGLEMDRAYRAREGDPEPQPLELPRIPVPGGSP